MARIGVDLGGSKIEAAVLADDGAVLHRRRCPTPDSDYPATLHAIAGLVQDLEAASGLSCRVGVGHPGAVSPATGLIKNANSTCLIGRDLQADLQAVLRREIRLANDADCFALSEAVDGAGRGASPVFGVILGTGVGGGIVIDGKLLAGANAIAGEWGHNPLPRPGEDQDAGPACYCGRQGCVETFLSGPGLVADVVRRFPVDSPGEPPRTAIAVLALAQEGAAPAVAALQAYHERLARALAAVINIVDPQVIVLGGGLSAITTLYARVPELWHPHVFSDQVVTRLLPPIHGDSSGVRGAAWLWPV